MDGCLSGHIAFSPYRAEFAVHAPGIHVLEFKAYGNRVNTFGAVHDCDEQEVYFDPNAWRTENDSWAYEYQLKRTGILKSPLLKRICWEQLL